MPDTPIRVLIAKVGLDGHDRGAKVVARALRDGGMDVIYTGSHRTPEEVVAAAVQEDVDILGVSLLSGAYLTLVPRIVDLLRAADATDMRIVVGGVIPDEDVPALKTLGVHEVMLQDTPPDEIVRRLRELVATRALTKMGSPEMAPHTPQRSPVAGKPGARLDTPRGRREEQRSVRVGYSSNGLLRLSLGARGSCCPVERRRGPVL